MAKRIPLSRGLYTLVDDEDYEWLSQWKWYASGVEWIYASRSKRGGSPWTIHMHRLVLGIVDAPSSVFVDHIDGNTLDNRRTNLRITDNKGNQGNRKISGGTSRYRGVSWNKQHGKWGARICRNRKVHWLGSFTEESEAARAYDIAAVEHFGEFARLNFPEIMYSQELSS